MSNSNAYLEHLEKILGGAKRSQNNWFFDCPWCGGENKFGIHVETHLAGCFRCGETGHVPQMLLRAPNLKNKQDLYMFDASPTIEQKKEETQPIQPIIVKPENYYPLTLPAGLASKPAWDYLKKRDVDPDWVIKNKVGFAISGPLINRIIFPIFHNDGSWRYYVARSFNESKPKTLNPKADRVIWQHHNINAGDMVIITEGIFSGYAARGIATLGSFVTEDQINELVNIHGSEYVICFDGDDAGHKGTIRLASQLIEAKHHNPWIKVSVVMLPKGNDPHDLRRCIDEYIDRRTPYGWETFASLLFTC